MKFHLTPLQIEKRQTINWLTANNTTLAIPSDTGITKEQLATLEGTIQGKIVYPWSPGYDDDRREFNNIYPANPLVIVYVASYQDIQLCLEFANQNKLITAIRSGGHSMADYSVCDGMVIDISGLKSVFVDPDSQTVW